MPPTLTGKYTFAALAVLAGSYVIRFPFGIALMTYITVVLLLASTGGYARVFFIVSQGRPVPAFADKLQYRIARMAATLALSLVWLVRCYTDLLGS